MSKFKKNIICLVGTRPEAIKLSPLIISLIKEEWTNVKVISSGQQSFLVENVFNSFDIKIDLDLKVKSKNDGLASSTANLIIKIEECLKKYKPNLVVIQGDTSSVLASALACFYNKIDICHVEAGLRTFNLNKPFPEEFNRTIVSKIARWNFAHSNNAKQNLVKEGISENKIFVSGNTSIDSLKIVLSKERNFIKKSKTVLITIHRRESFGEPLKNICKGIKQLALLKPSIDFILPVHTNPEVSKIINIYLSKIKNLRITEPLEYFDFINILKNSLMVMTDSGGIQEEASFLGIPILILRQVTEREEGINSGNAKISGFDSNTITETALSIINNKEIYRKMSKKNILFGDGEASKFIVQILKNDLT